MTKYVLNSGAVGKMPEKAKEFFNEIVLGLGTTPKILICLYAAPREVWEEKFAEDLVEIPSFMPEGVQPILTLALPDRFEEQIKNTDIIYFHGGDDHLLQYWLKKFDVPKIWEGKVIATNSASSNAMSKYFWTCDWRSLMDGLGIIPIKFLPHYKSFFGATDPRGAIDWEKGYGELKNYKEDLPIYALEEGDFVVINK